MGCNMAKPVATCENCGSSGISINPVVINGDFIGIVVDCNDCLHLMDFWSKSIKNWQIASDGIAIWVESPTFGKKPLFWDVDTKTWHFNSLLVKITQ